MPFLDEDGVTRLTEDYLDIFALKNSLDATKLIGTIPSANLPSYVDDVLEYAGIANFPATGETGKIYVDTSDNNTYRWTGTAYVSISNPLDYATQSEAETGSNNTKVMTPLRTAQEIAAKTDSSLSSSSTNPVRNSVIKQALDQKLDVDDYRSDMTWAELEDAITWGEFEGDISDTGTTYTENYHLTKPGLQSEASVTPINSNMDTIDGILADKLDEDDYRKAMTWGEVGDKYAWGVLGSTSQTTGTTYTDTLGLEKPGNNSTVDVSTINNNYDIIDEAVEGTQSSIAMIESHTAQSNHAVGSYFMLDNVLHKATSAIASGETITSGTNATPITLEQALSALNSSINTLQDSLSQDNITINGWFAVCLSVPGSSTINALFAAHARHKSVSVTSSKAFVNGAWVNVSYAWTTQNGDLIEVCFNKPSNVPDGLVLMDLNLTISF